MAHTKNCENCGREFACKNPSAVYCSKPCSGAMYRARNKDMIREQSKVYRDSNKDRLRAKAAKYYQDNKESVKSRMRDSYHANPEPKKAKVREYNRNNKEHIAARNRRKYMERRDDVSAQTRERYANDPDFRERAYRNSRERKAMKRGAHVYRMPDNYRKTIFNDAGGFCTVPGCWRQAEHVDHILPLSKGGLHIMGNLQGLCAHHNLSKADSHSTDYRTDEVKQRHWAFDYAKIGQAASAGGYI